jgi:fructose-1,6-bisphosphatase
LSLGNAFPPDFRRRQIEQCLVPGAVLYLEVVFPEVTKDKFLVLVASPDENYFNFIVNSETNSYIESRAHLNVCQVGIDAASHDFLRYDSKIACHEVLPISKQEIVASLMIDFDRYKGRISVEVKDEIVAAVKHAVTLNKVQQREIIGALDAQYVGS